jgi:hypothetical protein
MCRTTHHSPAVPFASQPPTSTLSARRTAIPDQCHSKASHPSPSNQNAKQCEHGGGDSQRVIRASQCSPSIGQKAT